MLFLLGSAKLVGAQTDEIQVYDAQIANPGIINLTWHNNYTQIGLRQPAFPGGIGPNRDLNGVAEWACGIAPWLEGGLYSPLYSITSKGAVTYDGLKFRMLFVSPDAATHAFFYGINFEFSVNAARRDPSRYTGGLRYVTGFPDRSPVRAGVSIGDTLASLYAVIGALAALHDRKVNGGTGQVVDVALYEAVFAAMESLLPDFSVNGVIRQRTGATIPGVVPSNTYKCSDGKEVIVAGNSDGIFKRLMDAIGRSDLARSPALSHNDGRVKAARMLDEAIQHWCSKRSVSEVVETLQKAGVPVGGIYTVAEIAVDEQFKARGMIEDAVLADGTPIQIPGIVPKLSATPGGTRWLGPKLGAHTREVLASLGIGEAEYEKLKKVGVV